MGNSSLFGTFLILTLFFARFFTFNLLSIPPYLSSSPYLSITFPLFLASHHTTRARGG